MRRADDEHRFRLHHQRSAPSADPATGLDTTPDSRIIIQLWRHPGENPGGIQLQNPGNPGNPGQNLASPPATTDPGLREYPEIHLMRRTLVKVEIGRSA